MDLPDFLNNGNGDNEIIPYREGEYNCAICGEKSRYYCRIRTDGVMAICKNVVSDKTTKHGERYIHILKPGSVDQNQRILTTVEQVVEVAQKADADKLNEVYTAFLESLELNENHLDNLVNQRGLSEQNLPVKLYGSMPSYQKRIEVVGKLAESFDLEGVPGFYINNGKWAIHPTNEGFYIPFRDEKERIIGLQIRKDVNVQPKYLWVSSPKKEKRTPSGSLLHIVNPEIIRESHQVFITEGALKADIIGELYNVGVMAMAGVYNLKADDFVTTMCETFPNVQSVVLAFDMDWEVNRDVKKALSKMLEAIKKKYLSAFVLTWERSLGKGFDDVLFKVFRSEIIENPFEYVKAEEFETKFLELEPEIIETADEQEEEIPTVIEEIETKKEVTDFPAEIEAEIENEKKVDTFGMTCGELLDMEFPPLERVIFGLGRGNVGLMVATTDLGKTTLALESV